MKIQIIGADSAFDGLNSSFFFKDASGRGVLIDCGFTVYSELNRRGMLNDVDVVLISHPHPDHTGSLTLLATYSRIFRNKKLLIGGADVSDIFRVQGILPNDFEPLSANDILNLKTKTVSHIAKYGNNTAMFIADKILYSGDTNESLLNSEYAADAKIIIHDATLSIPDSHAALELLNTASTKIKAKTWLTHIATHEREELTRLATKYGFAGVCHSGQEIKI